ncbi:hypothetical protein [Prauserella marina]|uniref:hypothetical protein n=1 Tax=Prauserella marina TaxID=530584 RepID=UPI003B849B65
MRANRGTGTTISTQAGIMGHVAEQRPDDTPGPEQPPGDNTPGAEVEPAQPTGPPRIDPEQLRQFQQFQEFQKFQELQRQQQPGGELTTGQTYPPTTTATQQLVPHQQPPRRKIPGWLEWLGKKLIGWLIFIILLIIGLTWAYNYFLGSDNSGDSKTQAKMGGGTYHTNEILSDKPYEAVRQVYDAIAQEDPANGEPLVAEACGRFDNQAGVQLRFAENLGYPGCREAIIGLHEKVTNVNQYAESVYPKWYDPTANTVRIDSCDFTISGGPALGTFVLTKQDYKNQWLITGHEPGPATCPAPSTGNGG